MCVLRWFNRVQLSVTPWNAAHQALQSMGFSWQEFWSGLPCSPPGEPPDPGIEPSSSVAPSLQADSYRSPQVSAHTCISLLCQLRGLRRDDTPLAASILSSQILVSNFILQLKRTRLLGETAGSRTQAENTPDEPRASYCVRK